MFKSYFTNNGEGLLEKMKSYESIFYIFVNVVIMDSY